MEKSERERQRGQREEGGVNEQGGGVVCSLWRCLLKINCIVLLHGICFVRVPGR